MNIALAFFSEMAYLSRSPGIGDRKGGGEIQSAHGQEGASPDGDDNKWGLYFNAIFYYVRG